MLPISRRISFGLVFATGMGAVDATAESRPYSYFTSNLVEYFSNTAYLPVLPFPNGEVPGDIYSSFDILRPTYLTRASTCFDGAVAASAPTVLFNSESFENWEISGGVDVPINKIAQVGAAAANRNLARVTLSFVDSRVDSLSDLQIASAMSMPTSECVDALLTYDLDSGGFLQLVPAIIQEVVYAKHSFAFHYETETVLKAEADLDAELKKLANVKVKADSIRTSDSSFSFTSDVDLPLAWRPAFISKDDVERMRELDANGFFLKLKRYFGFRSERDEEAEAIKSQFYDIVPRPEEIFEQMTSGSATKFDATNPLHLRYLERRGKVLAMSIDLYTG